MIDLKDLERRFIDNTLTPRERLLYAAQGRLYAALLEADGVPLPPRLGSEDSYLCLGIQISALMAEEQEK